MNISLLSRAEWLTAQRARLYGACLAVLIAALLAGAAVLTVRHGAARPMAVDFSAFWAAARLAVSGHAAAAYDSRVIEATERAWLDMQPGYLAFYYPPTFLLLVLPLGHLGYGTALATFLAAETALAVVTLHRILGRVLGSGWAWLPLLSFPGFLMNGLSGQNAALFASCLAGAAAWLDARPLLGGACLGLLACKPQLAACVPIALLASRRWRALLGCAATSVILAALSWLVLGSGVWRGFLDAVPMARQGIETIPIKWPRMQSLFGAVRLGGGGNLAAWAAQAVMSVAAASMLARLCAGRPGARLEVASLAAAALLVTPYLFDYDLAILAVPLACLTEAAVRTGWRPWEKLLAVTLFLLPLAAPWASLTLGLTCGPPAIAALLVLLAARARATQAIARAGRA